VSIRHRIGVLALALGVLLAAAAGAAPVLADDAPGAAASRLTIGDLAGTRVKGQYALSATLSTADGKPLNGREVAFSEQGELLGQRQAALGRATTDSTGVAVIAYQPAAAGRQTITVRFAGGGGYAPSTATAEVQVAEAVPPLAPEPLPLAPVGWWLSIGTVSLVAATWAVLLWALLSSVTGMRALARPDAEPPLAAEGVRPAQPSPESASGG
jgi:hypothetical protein